MNPAVTMKFAARRFEADGQDARANDPPRPWPHASCCCPSRRRRRRRRGCPFAMPSAWSTHRTSIRRLWTDDSDAEGRATHEPLSGGSLPLLYVPSELTEAESNQSLKTTLIIVGAVLGLVVLFVLLISLIR